MVDWISFFLILTTQWVGYYIVQKDIAVADLVDNYIVTPRVAIANGDREMISMLKMVHRKKLGALSVTHTI